MAKKTDIDKFMGDFMAKNRKAMDILAGAKGDAGEHGTTSGYGSQPRGDETAVKPSPANLFLDDLFGIPRKRKKEESAGIGGVGYLTPHKREMPSKGSISPSNPAPSNPLCICGHPKSSHEEKDYQACFDAYCEECQEENVEDEPCKGRFQAAPSNPLKEWLPCWKKSIVVHYRQVKGQKEEIHTREGVLFAYSGKDVIIQGVKGEEYPCDFEIFKETYSPVKEDSAGIDALDMETVASSALPSPPNPEVYEKTYTSKTTQTPPGLTDEEIKGKSLELWEKHGYDIDCYETNSVELALTRWAYEKGRDDGAMEERAKLWGIRMGK